MANLRIWDNVLEYYTALKGVGGRLFANVDFIPSSYDADLTMDGTAQSVAIATGATKLRVVNRGGTTEAIRVAFGTSAALAEAALTIASAAATTGIYIGAAADGFDADVVIGIPKGSTHFAIANAVNADTQAVSTTQGV